MGLLDGSEWILKPYRKRYIMPRYKLITNRSTAYPVYFVIDLITGQKVCEELNKDVAMKKQKDLEDWHNV